MRTRSPVIVLAATLALAIGAPSVAVEEAERTDPATFTLGPPVERGFAGWTEVARGEGSGLPRRIAALDDRLVGIGGARQVGDEWDYADRAWFSDDGLTWTEARLPGGTPQVTDLTVRPDGSMAIAVGYGQDEWKGAVWVTTDGLEWESVEPPSRREIAWVAASDEVVVVSAGRHLWTTSDLEHWSRVEGPGGAGIAYGPNGFLASEGGGQDLITRTALWHSPDGLEWKKVKLPNPLRDALAGISVFPLEDRWLLVPDKRGLMYTSRDGRRWRRAPRPPGIAVGYVWWLADLGEEVQASGWLPDRKRQPYGLWRFRPGQRVPKATVMPEGFVESPVAWNDQQLGYGVIERDDETQVMAMWRYQGSEPEGSDAAS